MSPEVETEASVLRGQIAAKEYEVERRTRELREKEKERERETRKESSRRGRDKDVPTMSSPGVVSSQPLSLALPSDFDMVAGTAALNKQLDELSKVLIYF
jgi:septal ring factor EnvC (AmiA/AmiB activator)